MYDGRCSVEDHENVEKVGNQVVDFSTTPGWYVER